MTPQSLTLLLEKTLEFANIGEVTMEYKNENGFFYSGTDYLGVANGLSLQGKKTTPSHEKNDTKINH